jgi:hypothetical protein
MCDFDVMKMAEEKKRGNNQKSIFFQSRWNLDTHIFFGKDIFGERSSSRQ